MTIRLPRYRLRHAACLTLIALTAALSARAATEAPAIPPHLVPDRAELLLAQGEHLVALEMLDSLVDALEAKSDEPSRILRRRALTLLSECHRRKGDRLEALRVGLEYQKEIASLTAPEFNRIHQEHLTVVSEDRLALGDHSEAQLAFQSLLEGKHGDLSLLLRIRSQIGLAVIQEFRSDARAANSWKAAEASILEVMSKYQRLLQPREKALLLQQMVTCQESLGASEKADFYLKQLSGLQSASASARPELESLMFERLARQAMLKQAYARAEHHARLAAKALAKSENDSRKAAVQQLLASTLQEQRRVKEAAAARSEAIALYERVLAKPGVLSLPRIAARRELVSLYHQSGRSEAAVEAAGRLAKESSQQFGADARQTIAAAARLATLQATRGDYDSAEVTLTRIVATLRAANPARPLELASALNNLAAVHRSLGDFAAARRFFEESLALRSAHLSEDHPDLATSHNNLASVLASAGRFSEAAALYSRVLEACARRGTRSDALRITTLLNFASLYRTQGQLEKAGELVNESLRYHERLFGDNAFGSVAHRNALATFERMKGNLRSSYQHSQKVLTLCSAAGQEDHPEAGTAHFNLAKIAREKRAYETARDHLDRALKIFQSNGQSALMSRAYNDLGLLAFDRGDDEEAERQFQLALQPERQSGLRPLERYSLLCNMAGVLHRRGSNDRALALLRDAINVSEEPRSLTTGAEEGRALYLSQFSEAYELLVEWSLAEGRIEPAFDAVERSRNRTFLDQIHLAGVDLVASLPEAERIRIEQKQMHQSRELMRAQQQLETLISDDAAKEMIEKASTELIRIRREYSNLWNEIRDASPAYRRMLAGENALVDLEQFRKNVVRSDEIILLYALGNRHSFLFLFDGPDRPVEVIPLEGARSAFDESSPALADASAPGTSRGIGGAVKTPKGEEIRFEEPPPESDAPQAKIPLTRAATGRAVRLWIERLRQREVPAARGIVGTAATKKGSAESGEREKSPSSWLVDALLPKAIRERIAIRKPARIVIIPDGPLHTLPFESLVLEFNERGDPVYFLDRLPPTAYAPSANILASVRRRAATSPESLRRLLSVADPVYDRDPAEATAAVTRGSLSSTTFFAVHRDLPSLPGTASESDRIVKAFQSERRGVRQLLQLNATEANLVPELRGCGWVHIATHGLVDESYGNLFGGLALTRPASGSVNDPRDDGLLSYGEILQLPLQECHLAVLSACQTNVGPERPLEAGSSLAQAVLAAGARGVVASHWNVSDASTAELMSTLFEAISKDPEGDLASSLHAARRAVRSRPEWSAPYYWAPFVLTGGSTRQP